MGDVRCTTIQFPEIFNGHFAFLGKEEEKLSRAERAESLTTGAATVSTVVVAGASVVGMSVVICSFSSTATAASGLVKSSGLGIAAIWLDSK